LFLLGSAFALLLHQRGLLALHGNSVVIDGHAYVFVGPSGSGKSTLAAWFHDRGYQLIADDVSVVAFSSTGEAEVRPGLPRFRLWREAIERSGRRLEGLSRSFVERQPLDKFDVPATSLTSASVPLGGVLVIERSKKASLTPLVGFVAVQALLANIYRGEYLRGPQQEAQWRACVRLARAYPIGTWSRRWSTDCFDEHASNLIETLGQLQKRPRSPA